MSPVPWLHSGKCGPGAMLSTSCLALSSAQPVTVYRGAVSAGQPRAGADSVMITETLLVQPCSKHIPFTDLK